MPLKKGLTNAVDRAEDARKKRRKKVLGENADRIDLGAERRIMRETEAPEPEAPAPDEPAPTEPDE